MGHKVCFISGSRAEFGLLRRLMRLVQSDSSLTLQLVVTGTHLSESFGSTVSEIEEDGFKIDKRIEILTDLDTPLAITESMGTAISKLGIAINELSPQIAVILGDRFEIMAAAQALFVLQVPIVHICGGDVGSGTFDNAFRDCISIMSDVHCVTNENAQRRIEALGVRPTSIHCVGATCVDEIKELKLIPLSDLCEDLGIGMCGKLIVVTYHPLTRGNQGTEIELEELLTALEIVSTTDQVTIVFTGSNGDPGGSRVNSRIATFLEQHSNCYFFTSLGHQRYLNLISHAALVLGNSSSGIYEAPYLATPSVDVGIRQKGRLAPSSVIRCEGTTDEILKAIHRAITFNFQEMEMIYGDGQSSRNIFQLIKTLLNQLPPNQMK